MIVSASEPWRSLGEGVDFSRTLSRGSSVRAFVARLGKTVAGFVVFTPEPVFARGGYLRAIAVAPEARKTGIGKALLRFAEQETARFAPNLYLCVSSFNRKARAFYRHLGYKKVGSIPGLIVPGASELILRKQLWEVSPARRQRIHQDTLW
jgi:ribosomal protein S18 acetylase RimI-like enzyme